MAICKTDCETYTLFQEMMLQIYCQNPGFGLFLVRPIVRWLIDKWKEADERARTAITQVRILSIELM
ncbi:MAG: hypothetical protein GY742_01900 [Hyphomicrobiales bacterium]|nr:hypothetical protein [Hyphomicrobiales bacterium]